MCRSVRYRNPVPGFALSNHVIGIFNVNEEEICELKCYLEGSCFSYNFGSFQGNDFLCELNDADSTSHPEDLYPRDGFVYRKAEVINVHFVHRHKILSTYLCTSIYPSIHLYVRPSIHYPSIHPCMRPPVNLSRSSTVCLPSCLFT